MCHIDRLDDNKAAEMVYAAVATRHFRHCLGQPVSFMQSHIVFLLVVLAGFVLSPRAFFVHQGESIAILDYRRIEIDQ